MVARLGAVALVVAATHREGGPFPGPFFWAALVVAAALPPAGILLAVVFFGWPSWVGVHRRRRVERGGRDALPDLLLALRMAAEEGLGVLSAMDRLEPEGFGALAAPLRKFRERLRLSFDMRGSLQELGDEMGFAEGKHLIEALLAGETLGAPLRQTLANQEALVRSGRLDRIRRRASFLPYALTLETGLLFVNGAILFGYPHLIGLLGQFGPLIGKGIL